MTEIIAQIEHLMASVYDSNHLEQLVDVFWLKIHRDDRSRSKLLRMIQPTPNIVRPMPRPCAPSSSEDSFHQQDTAVGLDYQDTSFVRNSRVRLSSTPSIAPPIKRRCRGPGKKQKALSPHFGRERFRGLEETLRREISDCTRLGGLQVVWKLVNAFRGPSPSTVQIDPSCSRARQLQCRIVHCDKLAQQRDGLTIRANIERRFLQVQLMAEYQRAVIEGTEDRAQVSRTFQEEMFPTQSQRERRSSWDYFRRVATPLFEAVKRFGYGSLIFPLSNVTMKSLQRLNRGATSDFLDYMKTSHPMMEELLRNLSGFLPRLLTWGLPEAHSAPKIVYVSYEDLTNVNDDSFDSFFYLEGMTNLELGTLDNIPPWPPQVRLSEPDEKFPEQDDPSEDGVVLSNEWLSIVC